MIVFDRIRLKFYYHRNITNISVKTSANIHIYYGVLTKYQISKVFFLNSIEIQNSKWDFTLDTEYLSAFYNILLN